MSRGRLILLVGGSSAGKTSLGRALQDLLPQPHLLLGIDAFWMAIPPRQLDLDRVDQRYYRWHVEQRDGRDYFRVTPGPVLDRVMAGHFRAVRAYLDLGLNVIADEVIWTRGWLLDLLGVFAGCDVTVVGVRVSDAEGARRELERGDRYPGWNRGSAEITDRDMEYDVEIDTTYLTPQEAARRVASALMAGPAPRAFAELNGRWRPGPLLPPSPAEPGVRDRVREERANPRGA